MFSLNIYVAGRTVHDDISIILGAGAQDAEAAINDNGSELKLAVIKLLHHELGLEVRSDDHPQVKVDKRFDKQKSFSGSDPSWEDNCPAEFISSARRPVNMERLKVTRISLRRWLQRTASGFQW